MKYKQLEDSEWLQSKLNEMPMRHIAQEIGCSYSGVHWAVKKFGLVIPKRYSYVYTEETRKLKSESIKKSLGKKFPNGRFGKQASNWKGGRRTAGMYIKIHFPDHPRQVQGAVFEHILVAEKTIGRYLKPGEIVHHKNHNKRDNRPENLQVMTRSQHVSHHMNESNQLTKRIEYLEQLLIDNHIQFDTLS